MQGQSLARARGQTREGPMSLRRVLSFRRAVTPCTRGAAATAPSAVSLECPEPRVLLAGSASDVVANGTFGGTGGPPLHTFRIPGFSTPSDVNGNTAPQGEVINIAA